MYHICLIFDCSIHVWLHRIFDHQIQRLTIQNRVFQSCAITCVYIQLKNLLQKKKKCLLAWKLLCKSHASDQACFYFALFFVPSTACQMYLCGFKFNCVASSQQRLIDESSPFLTHGQVSELEEKTSTSNRAQFLNRMHTCLAFNAPVT